MKRTSLVVAVALSLIVAVALLLKFSLPSSPPARVAPLIERVESAKRVSSEVPTAKTHQSEVSELIGETDVAYSTPSVHDGVVISASLEGTEIDGALQADSAGNLIFNIGIRDFFDYFLSTADELGAEASIDEIVRYAQAYLPENARNQALDLLENYLHYKQFEFDLQQTPINNPLMTDADTLAILRESHSQLKAERAKRFNWAANQALFGLEDEYAEFTLRTLEVGADPNLNEQQKAQKTEALLASLPPELAGDARKQSQEEAKQQQLQTALASSKDDSEIYALLAEQGYPQEEANQVVSYRQRQRDFDARYSQYRAAVNKVQVSGDPSQNQQAQLLQRFFYTPEEQTQASLRDLGQVSPTD